MTVDNALRELMRGVVREVVREELRAPASDGPELFTLAQVARKTKVSQTTLKRLRKEGSLLGDGEGRLARYTVTAVREALSAHARATGAPRAKALSLLGRGS